MFFTKTARALLSRPGLDVKFVNSMGIRSHICGPNDDKVSDPYITVFTFLRLDSGDKMSSFVSGVKRPCFQSKDLSHNFWNHNFWSHVFLWTFQLLNYADLFDV